MEPLHDLTRITLWDKLPSDNWPEVTYKKLVHSNISNLGGKYGVNIHRAILHPYPKLAWKCHVNLSILGTIYPGWLCILSGLKHLTQCSWHRTERQCRSRQPAYVLMDRYTLQANKVHFTKQNSDHLCHLCSNFVCTINSAYVYIYLYNTHTDHTHPTHTHPTPTSSLPASQYPTLPPYIIQTGSKGTKNGSISWKLPTAS